VSDETSIPGNLMEILDSPYPFSGDPEVKVKDTHMLVLVPATVDGENPTFDKLQEFIRNPKSDCHATKL
jgi:hypothetical protein